MRLNNNQNLFNQKTRKEKISFNGRVTDPGFTLLAAKSLDNHANNIFKRVSNNANYRCKRGTIDVYGTHLARHDTVADNLVEGAFDLLKLPLDLVDDAAKNIPGASWLSDLNFVRSHRADTRKHNSVRSLDGLQELAEEFYRENRPLHNNEPKKYALKLNEKLNKDLNEAMSYKKATYDTKKERFIARIASGITAAIFLGNDYYNKAIASGKDEKAAIESKNKKQKQEVDENLIEAFMQYAVMACFTKFTNKKVWASALIGTGIGLVARICSRISNKMPLKRVEVPQEQLDENIKDRKTGAFDEKGNKTKSLLTLKNILKGCGALIGLGFVGRGLLTTSAGKKLLNKYADLLNSFENRFIEQVNMSPEEARKIAKILATDDINLGVNEKSLAETFDALADLAEGKAVKKPKSEDLHDMLVIKLDEKYGIKDRVINVGERYKEINLLGMKINSRDAASIIFAPFKVVKDMVSYPYKIAKKMARAANVIKNDPVNLNKKLNDNGIANVYMRYKDLEKKFPNETELKQEFANYVKELRLASLNNKTVSKVNNSQIAVLAQTLGTVTGMYFNVTDEFNSSIKNGDSKYEAEVAARKRGLNKFARMTSQITISGTLNSMLARQYQSSLIGATFIVILSTFLTDKISRLITAMPTKKMNKEEFEQYQHDQKTGAMAWYYNGIDNLSK